ncbi:MAG: hypothetical protein QXN71_02260 [Candidatus Aenigmatarchaeota archaeon]
MKETQLAFAVILAAMAATTLLYITAPAIDNFFIIADLLVVALSFVALAFGIMAFRIHGLGNLQGRIMLLLSLGVFFWFLGELTWAVYEIVLGINSPLASVADMFWFAGYPLFFAGICLEHKVAGTKVIKKDRMFMSLFVIVLVFSSLSLYMILPVFENAEMTDIEKVVSAGYVIGDVVLLAGSFGLIISFAGGRFARPWLLITISIILFSIADIAYSYLGTAYETGSWIDLLWDFDYMFMAYAFYYYRQSFGSGLFKGRRQK